MSKALCFKNKMSIEIELVNKFYEDVWNNHDKTVIPEILHNSFTFRGSLGDEKQCHEGFIEYLDMVHNALGSYTCTIKEIVTEQSKAFAKMQFTGLHRASFLGVEPTGKNVTWDGAALFNFKDNKIISLWVVGDLKSLESQLNG